MTRRLIPTTELNDTMPLVPISFHDVAYDRRSSFKGNVWFNKVYDEFVVDLPVNTLYAAVTATNRKFLAKIANDMVALVREIDTADVTWRYRRFDTERPLYTYGQAPYTPEFLCIEFSYLNYTAVGVMLRLADFDPRDWKLFNVTQEKFKLSETIAPEIIKPVDTSVVTQEIVKHFKKPLGNIHVNADGDICGNDRNNVLYFVARPRSSALNLDIDDLTSQCPWMAEGDHRQTKIKPIPWDASVQIDKPTAKAIIKILKGVPKSSGEKAWFTVDGNKLTLVRRVRFNGTAAVVAKMDYNGFHPPCELDRNYYDLKDLVMAFGRIDTVGELKICNRGVFGLFVETEQVEYTYYIQGWRN